MSFGDTLARIEAEQQAEVLAETFGHLEPKPGTRHRGSMVLMRSDYDNGQIAIQLDFPTIAGGPGFYGAVHKYAERLNEVVGYGTERRDRYPSGIYRFEGQVRVRRDYVPYFVGRLQRLDLRSAKWGRP